MSTSIDPAPPPRRRLHFGTASILASATIAALIATGLAKPYPNPMFAYALCVAMGVFGLIQLCIAVAARK